MDRNGRLLNTLVANLGTSLEIEETLAAFDRDLKHLIRYDALAVLQVQSGITVPLYASGGRIDISDASLPELHEGRPVVRGSTMSFPLVETFGVCPAVTGILVLQRTVALAFSPEDLGVLHAVCPKLAVCLANAIRYRRAWQTADADPATGLANIRSLFQRLDAEMARARRGDTSLALLQCTIEGFDRTGRFCSKETASSIFQKVAQQIRGQCREYDFLARSGDDIMMILPGFPEEFLDEKCAAIERVVEDCGIEAGFALYAAIGAAFHPQDGSDAEDLLTAASHRLVLARQNLKSAPISVSAQAY